MPQDLTIAALTDVHGNAFAAEAVIADLRRFQPDLIVNLGDQVWGQADPRRALDLQRSLDAIEVRGNNDERLTMLAGELAPAHVHLQAWLAERLPESERLRLAALPLTATLAEGTVLVAHGTPASPWESLLLEWNGQAYVHWSAGEVQNRLGRDFSAEVELVVVGHTHREYTRTLGNLLLVNVGAVSFQNDGDPRARWTLLKRRRGVWSAEHHRVPFNWEAAAAWVLANQPVFPEEVDLHVRPVTDSLLDAATITTA
ncbi:metallophosphoesterase family protein [Deinococcus planocerae]|uniref:metallophosphoesterase family protein n=1 Tax=Deinococcus planocerae TaxID=1737569 RepID=UPI000C7F2CC1|nr:metallophosphoesterase family protein [Deinococcus planocerae]